MAKNKYTELDEPTGDKWKDKYLLGLKELEEKEIQWRDSEKYLRALITHLTDAADTSSLKLNKQLSVLREAINDGVAANKLKKAINEVADSILSLDAIRKKNKKDGSQNLVNLIEKIKPAGKIESKLDKLSSKIAKTSRNKEVTPLINELAKLLVHGIALADNNSKSGFFTNLLKGKKESSKQEELSDESIAATERTTPEDEHNNNFEKTDAFSEKYESEKDGVFNYVAIDLGTAVNSLKTLLEKMVLPKDLQLHADEIKRKLSDETDEKAFLHSLEKTVVIVATILGRVKKEKKETEDFLKLLTSRLHELDYDIRETVRVRELTHRFGIEMASEMQVEMKTMEQGLQDINDIEKLKSSLHSRVIMLRNHVDKFLLEEDEQDKQAEEIINQLKNKVKLMEEESEELREQMKKEREQTLRDVLTEIPNRLAYEERLDMELARFKRNNEPFVLVVWDIDLFKNVNDKYGHAAGDQVLKLVATILNKNIREIDFVARYGGEEFVSILPSTDLNGAQKITDKVREVIESSDFHFRDEAVKVTLSAGFAEIIEDENPDDLFVRADKALYKAKENGRNICQAAE